MSYRKDSALEAIRLVHGQIGTLENVLADLQEISEFVNELISGVEEDISRRDNERIQ